MLTSTLKFTETAQQGAFHLFETGEGGNGASVIVEEATELPEARQGFGTVHHCKLKTFW